MNKKQSYEILSYEYVADTSSKAVFLKKSALKNQAVKDLKEIADYLNNSCLDPEIKFTVEKETMKGIELFTLNMNAPKIDVSDVHLYILQAFAYMSTNDVGCDTLSLYPGLSDMTVDRLFEQTAKDNDISID